MATRARPSGASRIRSVAREVVARVIRASGLPWIVRATMARENVTIVVYHDPAPEVLDRHLTYLRGRYTPITLDALGNALHDQDWSRIPPRAIVVTVDDGHRGNRDLGAVFALHGVVPTIYLCSQIIGTRRAFWFERHGSLSRESLKGLPNAGRLRLLAESGGFTQTKEYDDAMAMNDDELRALAPVVDFGAHTRFHPILTMCNDEECESEILESRRELEERFGRQCRHFSYPNGDHTEREVAMARAAGFRTARGTDVGRNGPGTDPYRLRVTGVTDDASISVFAVQLSGLTAWIRTAAMGSLTGATRKHRRSEVA